MSGASPPATLLDLGPAAAEFRAQVLAGLHQRPRILPSKFFYDQRGSELFEQICQSPEYYITRAEMQILQTRAFEIARACGRGARLIGLGTGAGTKTRLLLEELHAVAYLPVDISKEQLAISTAALRARFPTLEIQPVCADYLEPFEMPPVLARPERTIIYFPGSTIGNLEPSAALLFLNKVRELAGTNGRLLLGADLQKSVATLERAYNDAAGVTALFNLNLLERINRELGGDFRLACWRHFAFFNEEAGRIEMHLVSDGPQAVHLGAETFDFDNGEHLVTEYSYKYTPAQLIALASEAGFTFERLWTDADQLFGLFLFRLKQET